MRLYEALRETRHILLLPPGSNARCVAEFRDVSEVAYRSLNGTPWLVGPDGYLAARGVVDITAYLRSVFTEPDGAHVCVLPDCPGWQSCSPRCAPSLRP